MKLFDIFFRKESSNTFIPALHKNSWESLPNDFTVTDTETARRFFMACEGNYNIMTQHFSKNVYEAFNSVTDYKLRCAFTKEFALKKFNSILNGEADQIPSVIFQVYDAARRWGMDFYDEEIIIKLTAVAKASNEGKLKTNDTWIKYYLSQYNTRSEDILKIQPLVEMTYEYLTTKYPNNNDYYIDEVIKLCSSLKGLMLEMRTPDVSLGMEFTLSDDDDISKIINEFSSICNNSAGQIKEMIYQLNCIYGIKTPVFFLTAASEAVDYGSNNSWDIFRFAVVFYHENISAVFECVRNRDGYFYPERKYMEQYPLLAKFKNTLAQAIAFYRNKSAYNSFCQALTDNCSILTNHEKQKALCKSFGDCFAYMRERIKDQSIKATLNELLDCCEEISPIIGIDQTTFYDPATEQEIEECEARTGLTIPQPMREFLMFSNGGSLFDNSTIIYSTSKIGEYTLDGYDDENAKIYIPIGDFLGDGTAFVMNKTTG